MTLLLRVMVDNSHLIALVSEARKMS
jgi:hypothetical protein